MCGTLLRLVTHNRSVFGEYYVDILTDHIKTERQWKHRKELKDEESSETTTDSTSVSTDSKQLSYGYSFIYLLVIVSKVLVDGNINTLDIVANVTVRGAPNILKFYLTD